jgi:hypothetical protein
MPPFRRKKRDVRTHARTDITRKALKFGAILEKTRNSNLPTLKLVNGPAGRESDIGGSSVGEKRVR